jgi:hypothetical protein
MLALNTDQDFHWDIIDTQFYTMEILDTYGKIILVEFNLSEYEDAYSYCQHNSAFNSIDSISLTGGHLKQPLVFVAGLKVKG